jgi:hypothetical protein
LKRYSAASGIQVDAMSTYHRFLSVASNVDYRISQGERASVGLLLAWYFE